MRHGFPSMWHAEQEQGSLMKGMIRNRSKTAKKNFRPRVISFPEGLSELTTALRNALGQHIRLHEDALNIERTQNGFSITSASDVFRCERIIFALPAYDAAPMLQAIAPNLSNSLRNIIYPPVAVVYLGYSDNQFSRIPEGFGGLIPSKENRKILGIIFSSSNFPNRAPADHLLLTIIMGGATQQDIVSKSDTEILDVATAEVNGLLNPRGAPAFQHVLFWKRAIPQYNVGYGAVLDAINLAEAENPGMHFIGNYRNGISMGASIKNATELAKKLV